MWTRSLAWACFQSGGSARSQFSSGELASCPTQYSSTEQKNIDVHRRKELNMHFKSVNKMCHFISIWRLGGIRHSNFYWHIDTSNGKKKKEDRQNVIVYLLHLEILILIKVLLLETYKDKNYLISQSLPTKQRTKIKILHRERDVRHLLVFSRLVILLWINLIPSELLTNWLRKLRTWRYAVSQGVLFAWPDKQRLLG